MRYLLQGFDDVDSPTYERDAGNLAAVGGHLGQLAEDHATVLIWAIDGAGKRLLVGRYDRDGFDL